MLSYIVPPTVAPSLPPALTKLDGWLVFNHTRLNAHCSMRKRVRHRPRSALNLIVRREYVRADISEKEENDFYIWIDFIFAQWNDIQGVH